MPLILEWMMHACIGSFVLWLIVLFKERADEWNVNDFTKEE